MTADRGPRRKRAAAIGVPVLTAAVTAGILVGLPALRPAHPAAAAAAATGTAPVVRTDLVNTISVNGSLSYAGSYTIVNQAQGTAFTWLPAVGATIRRGQRIFEVDGAPVTLFYGTRPEWRSLSEGVTPGPDVAQLDRNLIALGYGQYLTVSDYFTGATAYAVELWQQALGLPVTGTVALGQVAFAAGALRVASVTASLGSAPQPGASVLTATSPVPLVTAEVPVTQSYLLRPGDSVSVTLPNGLTTTPGVVTAIASVATAGSGTPDSGAPPGSQGPGSGGGPGGNSPDTVAVSIRLIRPAVAGNLAQAPVTVNIVSARQHDVLAVPISALVALAGGGYAVEVVHGSGPLATRQLVAVQTGLFSDSLVQVSGAGITSGLEVEVPAP